MERVRTRHTVVISAVTERDWPVSAGDNVVWTQVGQSGVRVVPPAFRLDHSVSSLCRRGRASR